MSEHEPIESALERVTASPADVVTTGQGAPAQTPAWKVVHHKLRGRYAWAILLATVGLVGGGLLGWRSKEPEYRGEGLIYIAPSMPSPQDPAGMNVLPMFEGFMAFQVEVLQSTRATNLALETKAWKEGGGETGPNASVAFEKRRKVSRVRGTQHVRIEFVHTDPDIAIAGVHALIDAYLDLSAELNNADERLDNARRQAEKLESRIELATEQIFALASEHGGVEGLKTGHAALLERVLKTTEALDNLRTKIEGHEAEGDEASVVTEVPAEEIAVNSPQLMDMLLQLAMAKAKDELLAERLGEECDERCQTHQQIKVLQAHIDAFTKAWNKKNAESTTSGGGVTLGQLKTHEKGLAKSLEKLRAERRTLDKTRVEVDRLQAANEELMRRLKRMEALEEQLAAQLVGKGRVRIADKGTRPLVPHKDSRKSYAAAGGLLGGAFGLLIVLLFGVMDRRLKDAGDVDQALSRLRLLGLLPSLPIGLYDPEGRRIASHCAHQIRTLLQIGHADREQGTCIAVSGPGIATGKTTLTTALGLSFGSSRSSTVLIDADLSGQGLTRRVAQMLLSHVRRKTDVPGETEAAVGKSKDDAPTDVLEPLAADGDAPEWPLPEELKELLTSAIETRGIYGAKESGLIDDLFALADLLYSKQTRDEMAAALMAALESEGNLTFQAPSEWIPHQITELSPGHTGFNGVPLSRYLYRTGIETVRFLPLRGLGEGGGVSVSTISKILGRIRAEFDVALIDTGPVPGSVETSIVAAQSDSVVVVLSPGDHRPDAERAVAHMEQVGARIAGVVFNRADQKEILKASLSRSSPRRAVHPGA